MKLFQRDPTDGRFYLAQWGRGYVMALNDWKQLFQWRKYNWITIRPFAVELELEMYLGTRVELTVVVLGMGLYWQQQLCEPTEAEQQLIDGWAAEFGWHEEE